MKQEAIYNIYPEVKRIVESNDGSLKSYDVNEKIINVDMSKVSIKQKELQDAYDNIKYQRDRATEYPSMADQLDDLYHKGIDGWKATIKKVKDKYPKE